MGYSRGRNDVCRGKDCGKSIIWLKTTNDRAIPVDPQGVIETDEYFDRQRHMPHHATCPNAGEFRKKKKTT